MANYLLLADRTTFLMERFHKSQSDLARIAGVKPSSINGWLSGKTKYMKAASAKALSLATGVSMEWLIDGSGDPDPKLQPVSVFDDSNPDACQSDDQIVFIKQLEVACGCGAGRSPSWEEEHNVKPRAYRLSWFQHHGRKPENCVTFYAEGDSMQPTLYDGDCVLIDTSDKYRIDNGHVYAFYIGDEIKIKRLYRNMRGDITIASDNTIYDKEILRHDDESIVMNLIGRVIEKSSSSNL